ncbi:hypothetical protein [Desulfonema magnum]|nr:hypothetical protein [Desulfonema magnum]
MKRIIFIVFILLTMSGNAFAQKDYYFEPSEEQLTDTVEPDLRQSPLYDKPKDEAEKREDFLYKKQRYEREKRKIRRDSYPASLRRPTQYDYVYTNAYPFFFELNANQSEAEFILGHTWEENENNFLTSVGIGALYSDENYKIINASFALGNRELIERVNLGMGFKGMWGTAEEGRKQDDLGAVGFLFSAVYDIPEVDFFYYGVPFDFEISGEICIAPSQLCFDKLNEYTEIKTSFGLYVLGQKKGIISVGFRYLQAQFEDEDDEDNNWEKSNNAVFVGYRFIF